MAKKAPNSEESGKKTETDSGSVNRNSTDTTAPSNFIKDIIEEDRKNKKNDGRVATRFPPEPNGYLHIGHAKSICLNFGLASEYQGTCNLRFDDTNPTTEEVEYVESIKSDIKWLGFDWGDRLYYASDYFDKLYQYAVQLIKNGKAYVCSLNEEEIKDYRGDYYKKAKESPYRSRPRVGSLELNSIVAVRASTLVACTLKITGAVQSTRAVVVTTTF